MGVTIRVQTRTRVVLGVTVLLICGSPRTHVRTQLNSSSGETRKAVLQHARHAVFLVFR